MGENNLEVAATVLQNVVERLLSGIHSETVLVKYQGMKWKALTFSDVDI